MGQSEQQLPLLDDKFDERYDFIKGGDGNEVTEWLAQDFEKKGSKC